MLSSVFLKTLREQFRPILFWGLGIGLFIVLLSTVFPSVKESAADFDKYLENLPPAFKTIIGESSYSTPEGYFNSEFFSITLPLVFMIFALIFATGAILGEESKGTLQLLLANPIPRWRIVIEKFAAMVISIAVIVLICWEAFFLGARFINVELNYINVLLALVSVGLLATLFGSFAFALSGFSKSRGLVVGLSSLAIAASFFLNALAPMVEPIKNLQKISPFYLYNHNNPLFNGLLWKDVLIFVIVTLILLVLGIWGFSRRDVGN